MASVNKVIVLGNVGKDPEVRYNSSGVAFCTLSIATSRSWKNKESGEKQEETEWHRVTFNDKLAEIVGQYAKKGKPIYAEGRLKTRKWQDKDGRDVYTTEIIASEMQLLGGREQNLDGAVYPQGPGAPNTQGSPPTRARIPQRAGAAAELGHGTQAPRPSTGFDDMDDDLPF